MLVQFLILWTKFYITQCDPHMWPIWLGVKLNFTDKRKYFFVFSLISVSGLLEIHVATGGFLLLLVFLLSLLFFPLSQNSFSECRKVECRYWKMTHFQVHMASHNDVLKVVFYSSTKEKSHGLRSRKTTVRCAEQPFRLTGNPETGHTYGQQHCHVWDTGLRLRRRFWISVLQTAHDHC